MPFHIECKIHERAFNSKQRRLKGFADPEHSRWPSLFYNSGDYLENKDSQAGTDSPWGFRGRVALSPSNYIFALTTMRIKNCASRQSVLKHTQKPKGHERLMPFVTMYHLAVKNLKQIMMEHRSLIYNQPLLKTVFRKPPIISYKKGKSLKDMLVRAKYNLKAIMRRDHKSHMGSSCMSVLTFILRIRLFYWKKDPTKTRTQPYWSFKSQRSNFAKKRFASWKVLCLVAVIWLRGTLSTKIIEPCIGKEQSVKRWFRTPVPPPWEGRLRTALENAALNEPLSFVASKFFATTDYSFSIWYSKM